MGGAGINLRNRHTSPADRVGAAVREILPTTAICAGPASERRPAGRGGRDAASVDEVIVEHRGY